MLSIHRCLFSLTVSFFTVQDASEEYFRTLKPKKYHQAIYYFIFYMHFVIITYMNWNCCLPLHSCSCPEWVNLLIQIHHRTLALCLKYPTPVQALWPALQTPPRGGGIIRNHNQLCSLPISHKVPPSTPPPFLHAWPGEEKAALL